MTEEQPRILVVDDEPGIRDGCRRILEPEGFFVDLAEDGVQGLARFRERSDYSLILADLKMPTLGGLELLEEIRRDDPDAVVVVITAFATIETAVEATRRGAFSYVPKPFTPDELLLHVRNGLERRALTLEARRLREDRERRLLEVAAERSRCGAILQCITDGVVVANREGSVVLANEAAARALPGCERGRLPAPLAQAVAVPEIAALLREALAAREAGVVSREAAVGEAVYMVNAGPVLDAAGAAVGAVAVLRDITALKKLDAAKTMFVTLVAHEVNRPLAAIEGFLGLLTSDSIQTDPARGREMMKKALKRSRTLRQMVGELMNLTALETGRFTLRRERLDLGEVVKEACEACRDRAAEKQIALTLDDEGAPLPGLADRQAMLSVFTNLVDNAIKYTPAAGRVTVRARRDGAYASVTVRDTGLGIEMKDQAKVFDEFFRVRNSRTADIPGTGLGLALVKRFVETHQGRITLASTPGEGSEFTVRVPLDSSAESP